MLLPDDPDVLIPQGRAEIFSTDVLGAITTATCSSDLGRGNNLAEEDSLTRGRDRAAIEVLQSHG